MTPPQLAPIEGRAQTPRLVVELTNSCNLRCAYCVRDEEALYHTRAEFFPVELLLRVMRGARESYGVGSVSFTGGETTIHPRFSEIVDAVAAEGYSFSFVTNGWHIERVMPALLRRRESVEAVAFSLDGAARDSHDRWRGEGSFVRIVRGMARCHMGGVPFIVKTVVRRDTLPQLQDIALFAARLGASAVHFSHLLPTSNAYAAELGLTREERTQAEQEIAILSNVFKMEVGIAVGYYNVDPGPPCTPLRGLSCNIDYRGRLSLCCDLSGYRGATGEADVVADLNVEEFAPAFERLRRVVAEQNERRRAAIESHRREGRDIDLYTGSPCLFCLQSFGKIPWHDASASARSLPVVSPAGTAASDARA
jgi:MoaA/NifB/PqqE/SkfB family radical SAM enzyme